MAARKNKEVEEQTDQKEEQVSVEETLSEIEARVCILEKEDATL